MEASTAENMAVGEGPGDGGFTTQATDGTTPYHQGVTQINISGQAVAGYHLDDCARCAHWRLPTDVVTFQFACCASRRWWACRKCHDAAAGHATKVVSSLDDDLAICGVCGAVMTAGEWLALEGVVDGNEGGEATHRSPQCSSCATPFNPRCKLHADLYVRPTSPPGGKGMSLR